MLKKLQLITILFVGIVTASFSINGFAHAEVLPLEVKPDSTQLFALGIATEREVPTVKVRLALPDGLRDVTPTVKLGWNIEVKKDGDKATEIQWAGGIIPVNQRDEFSFSAQSPAKEGELKWKVYQTYQDGTEVSWDQEPKTGTKENDKLSPYSVTKVTEHPTAETGGKPSNATNNTLGSVSGVVALVLSVVALSISLQKNQKKE
jgi:uncharacterized protein YcnI